MSCQLQTMSCDSAFSSILSVWPLVEVSLDLGNIEDLCLVGKQLGCLALPLDCSKASDVLKFQKRIVARYDYVTFYLNPPDLKHMRHRGQPK